MKTEMKTMSEIIAKLQGKGYAANFGPSNNVIENVETGKAYKPEDLKIIKIYRFEGESDPDDMGILYVLEANDGSKGTYVDAYGTYGNEDEFAIANFIKQIPQEIKEDN
jgi:hypothetical protein